MIFDQGTVFPGNNVSWFAPLRETWLGNNVSATLILSFLGGRSRRDTTMVDYSDCSVRVKQHKLVQGKQLELQIILVCAQPPEQKYVCDAMFKQGMVTSCTDESGTREAKPKTDPPTINPQRYVF